jgi:hypothetical protein
LLTHNNNVKGVPSPKEKLKKSYDKIVEIFTTAFVLEERTDFYFISDNSRQPFAFDSRVD